MSDLIHTLDGWQLDYTYEGGWRFRVHFYDGLAAYEFLGDDTGEVSNSNKDIPYQARMIRDDLYHVMWHEENINDLVSLVIDKFAMKLYSAALLGYKASDFNLHFEAAEIHTFKKTH